MEHQVVVYPAGERSNLVIEFYKKLNASSRCKVQRVLKYLQEYGITPDIQNIKKLHGYDFWEVRILGKDNLRIFISELKNTIYVLHIFKKKSQTTPIKELYITQKRLYNLRSELDL